MCVCIENFSNKKLLTGITVRERDSDSGGEKEDFTVLE